MVHNRFNFCLSGLWQWYTGGDGGGEEMPQVPTPIHFLTFFLVFILPPFLTAPLPVWKLSKGQGGWVETGSDVSPPPEALRKPLIWGGGRTKGESDDGRDVLVLAPRSPLVGGLLKAGNQCFKLQPED